MDGVLADFVKHFNDVMGTHFPEHVPIDNIGKIKHTLDSVAPHFWDEIPPMPDANALMSFLQDKDFEILTAYAEWSPGSKKAKVRWCAKHYGLPPSQINTVVRKEKADYATTNGQPNVLIDDYIKNVNEWRKAGGIAIHHVGARSTIAKLKEIINNRNKTNKKLTGEA